MSGDIDLYNANELCRLCLKSDGTILPIFGLEHSSRDCIPLSYKIKACVSVEVCKNDELPKNICVGCVHQVDSWHRFKSLCDNSQVKLKSWFKPTESNSRPPDQEAPQVKQEYTDSDVICCDDEAAVTDNNIIFVDDDSDVHRDDMSVGNDDDRHDDDNSDSAVDDSNSTGQGNDPKSARHRSRQAVKHRSNLIDKQTPRESNDKQRFGKVAGGSESASRNDSGFISDERMLADFHDELAKDLELNYNDDTAAADDSVDNNQTGEKNSNILFELLKDKSSNIIDRISSEINRRLSCDDDLTSGPSGLNRDNSESDRNDDTASNNDDNVDDSVSVINEDDDDEEEVVEKRELRPRNNRTNYGSESSGIVIVEGFSLSDYNSLEPDPVNDVHRLYPNQPQGASAIHGPDLEVLEPANGHHQNAEEINIGLYNVKQEPVSPSSVAATSMDPVNFSVKREIEDWTLMTPEPIDIKPDISVLERVTEKTNYMDMKKSKRAKYPQFKNGIPCDPCKYTFPNYVKWLRHTKSHKHQRNIAIYEMNHGRSAAQMFDPMNFVATSMGPAVASQKPKSSYAEVKQNPCPLGGCQASFKYRRNLVTHVKTHHGYRLKDLEARNIVPRPNHVVEKDAPNGDGTEDFDIETGQVYRTGENDDRKLFKCSHCPKEFEYKSNLKNHLLLKHRITSLTANLKCDRCFKRFYKKTGLLSHMRSCGTHVKSRKCPYCFMNFATNKETVYHKARCTKRFANDTSVQSSDSNNLQSNSNFSIAPDEDGKFSCRICNITFEVQSVYCNHMEMYHAGMLEEGNQQDEQIEDGKAEESNAKPEQPQENEIPENDLNKLDVVVDESRISSLDLDCRYCTQTFNSVEELQEHWDYHDINKIFQCKLCLMTLNCKRYFQDHMRSHFIQHRGQYLCWTCFKPFNNRRALTAHKSMHIKVKCSQCKQTFNSIIDLEKHKNVYHRNRLIDSLTESSIANESLVEKSYIGDETIKDGMSDLNETVAKVDYNCNICKKSFSCESALEKHSKLHNPVKLEVMKKFAQSESFSHPGGFKRKYISVAKNSKGGGRVQCDKCFSNFTTIMSLRKHKNLNRCPLYRTLSDEKHGSNVKMYNCRYCKMSCQTVVTLYRHLKTCNIMHMKRKAAGVDSNHCIKCRKQFSSLGVLFNHEKYCAVQPPQQQQTNIIDDTSMMLNRRELTISLVDPTKTFKCVNCNMVFNSDESLSRHYKFCKVFGGIPTEENVMTGERFFNHCNKCNRKFTTSLSYKLHKKFCSPGGGQPDSLAGNAVSSTATSVGAVRCKGCARVFISIERLRAHEKICKSSIRQPSVSVAKLQKLHHCTCGVGFTDAMALAAHKETCSQQHYEASSATGSTSSVSSSVKSSNANVPNRLLTCEYCYKTFNKYHAKNSHMRVCQVKLKLNPKKKKYTYRTQPSDSSSSLGPPAPSQVGQHNCVMCKGSFNTEDELIDHSCQDYQLRDDDEEVNNITVEPDINLEMFDLQPVQHQQQQPQHIPQQQPKFMRLSPKKVYKCAPCNKIFSGSSALNKHSQIFHGQSSATAKALINRDGSIRCPKCPRNFRDHKSLTHHMGWHTRQGGLQVTTTTETKSVPSFPPAEIILTSGEPQRPQKPPPQPSTQQHLTCPVCFRKFLGRGPLGNHIKTHANVLNNRANTSGTADGSGVNTSLLANVKKQNHKCKICPKVFKDKLSLMKHHNLHKTVNPANSMKAKLLSSFGKTYVSCNICHKILSSNSIPRHNRLHRLRQDGIPDNFPIVNIMGQHQQLPPDMNQQNQGPTLFPCGFCFKLFRYQKSLRDHMKNVHNYNRDSLEDQQQYDEPIEGQPMLMDEPLVEMVEGNDDDDDDDEDVYIIDDEENEATQLQQPPQIRNTPSVSASTSSSVCADDDDDGQTVYKCEICDKSWRSRSVYLRHVNAPSHKELTKRLSDIITRVNHDVNDS